VGRRDPQLQQLGGLLAGERLGSQQETASAATVQAE